MPSEPRWIEPDEVIWINQQIVAGTGEVHHLREPALLESAVARPRNRWTYGELDVVHLAVTFLFGLAMNHPFEQGNKRTGATASLMFLEANGYEWSLIDNGEFGMWVLDMVNNQISESDLAELMRPYVK